MVCLLRLVAKNLKTLFVDGPAKAERQRTLQDVSGDQLSYFGLSEF